MPLFRNSRGFAYIALLVVIVIIGISLGAAGRYWSNVVLRDKEEELLFRGDQYRRAIELYYKAGPLPQYPSSIEDLLNDNRTGIRHYLRKRYKDPISGEDFVEIRHPITKRIIGVHSPSDKKPLKQSGFPARYSHKPVLEQSGYSDNKYDFEGKSKYSEWLFVTGIFAASTSSFRMPPPPVQQH